MRRATLVWLVVVAVVALVLGAASFIVATNPGPPANDALSDFSH
jgi:hypothetical protein